MLSGERRGGRQPNRVALPPGRSGQASPAAVPKSDTSTARKGGFAEAGAPEPSDHPEDMAIEIAHLRGLDLAGLRAAWRSATGRNLPAQVPKHLLLRMLAYRLQADKFGGLDKDTVRHLDRMAAHSTEEADASASLPQAPADRRLRPGTILMREWQGVPQRVMVLANGFAWQDQVFASLSEVAFTITGTRWNGPRFFGLRDKMKVVKRERRT